MFVILFLASCAAPATLAPTQILPTQTFKLELTATQTPIPTSTITLAPTKYPTTFAEQKVEEYLRTNNGCNLPCFWGIIPSETDLNDAIKFFQPFGITKRYAVGLYILSKKILNGASLFEENGKIIGVEVFGEGTFNDSSSFLKSQETFWKIWEAYLPQNIIAQYGFPDRIWFDTYNNPEVSDPDKPVGYSIWFFYDQNNFLIVYTGITTKSPRYTVCLGNKPPENRAGNLSPYIELLINTSIPLEDFAIERGIIDQSVNFYSETNPEIPTDDFKKMFNNQTGCFDIPSERLPF